MFFISLLISFLFYGNSISNGYSMDDELVTSTDRRSNPITEKGITGIGKIFSSNYAIDGKQNYEYRPIVTLSYAIEWSLFHDYENRVHVSHFINVFLYGLCGFLIFQMLQVLFQGKASTFCAIVTILFLAHPIHSEVVNNLKNRDEILCLIFASLSVIAIFKGIDRKHWKYFLFGLLFFTLSLLSKRSSVPLLVIIPMMMWFFRDFSKKNLMIVGTVVLGGQVILKLLKSTLLEEKTTRIFNYVENPLFQMDFIARIPMYFYSNLFYVQKLILPYPLCFYYGFNSIPIVGFTNWQFFAGIILIGIGMFFAIQGLIRKSIVSFSILFFFLAIGGICNLLVPAVGIVAERFVFIGSIGFILLITWLIFKWRKLDFLTEQKLKSNLYLPLALLIIPAFIFNINRNKDWQSKKSLYLADSVHLKESAKANSLLAAEYQDEAFKLQPSSISNFDEMMQKVDSALIYYNRSISVYENYESNLNNRGAVYFSFYYDYLEAIKSFKLSVKNNPNYYEGTLNIGNSYAKIAQIFLNLENISKLKLNVQTTGVNSINETNIDDFIRKTGLYKTLAMVNQFEYTAKEQLKNPLSINTVNLLSLFAQNLEKQDKTLKKIGFSGLVNKVFTHFSQNKITPNLNLLNGVRKAIYADLKSATKLTDEELEEKCAQNKNKYFDSAKVYFNKTIHSKPDFQNVYNSAHEFALILNDLNYIIQLEEKYIKNFPNQYHSFQYIEIANSYNTLGNKAKARENFKNAALELNREKTNLATKKQQSVQDLKRINDLKQELKRLKDYLIRIKIIKENEIENAVKLFK